MQIYFNNTNPTATFPILTNGSAVQSDFKTAYDWSVVIDQDGIVQYSASNADTKAIGGVIDGLLATAIQPTTEQPKNFRLFNNYPNPFNPTTTISYQLPQAAQITLSVFDTRGRLIKTIARGQRPAGTHRVVFDGGNLAGGVYFYNLRTDRGFNATQKMLLVK